MTLDDPTDGSPRPEPVRVALPQDQRAPGEARRAAREALIHWRLPELVDSVVLAVSELVTNAIRYGRPTVSLQLRRQAEQVRVEVHDGDPTEPPGVGGEVSDEAESGRGLGIVQVLADGVAVEQVDDDGKIVQADFSAPPATASAPAPPPDPSR